MARPNKTVQVCNMPSYKSFCADSLHGKDIGLIMSVEEYESIRLIDYAGNSQLQAAQIMKVSRTTIQALYSRARTKLARFLVEGTKLTIEGGNFTLCGVNTECRHIKRKGDMKMKIAVTYENGQVFQHFGHTEQFKVYDVEDGKIVSSKVIGTDGQGHGALAGLLFNGGVQVLICGGIGGGARNALAEAGVELYPGASGDADAQVESFLAGKLQYNPDTMCSHHSHAEGQSCGDHGCHSHSCH